jgi:sec-independent protein translocase protein TatA
MPGWANGWELVIIVVIGFVLFGSKRMPGAARSLGQSLRIFKAETKGLRDDYKEGLEGKEDAAVRRGEILAEQPSVGGQADSRLSDLERREAELRRGEEALQQALRREREREEALRRDTETR